ncbi:hypothetical protein DJ017_16355 [Phenylobacterium soli]|uniref:Transposase n=1 Tax=Phenylobacterium soli TaxID=2170551 RepID=A0A328AN35_9CAUL|nr:hypothetical protein DJ017_16355 [Phenylobacterium soli]
MSPPVCPFDLERENALLRRRNAQLQCDLMSARAQFDLLWQRVERLISGGTPSVSPSASNARR